MFAVYLRTKSWMAVLVGAVMLVPSFTMLLGLQYNTGDDIHFVSNSLLALGFIIALSLFQHVNETMTKNRDVIMWMTLGALLLVMLSVSDCYIPNDLVTSRHMRNAWQQMSIVVFAMTIVIYVENRVLDGYYNLK